MPTVLGGYTEVLLRHKGMPPCNIKMSFDSSMEVRGILSNPEKMRKIIKPIYYIFKEVPAVNPILTVWEPFVLGEQWDYEVMISKIRQSARILVNHVKEAALKEFGENYLEKMTEYFVAHLPLKCPRDFIFSKLIEKFPNERVAEFYCSRTNLDKLCGSDFTDVADFLYDCFTSIESKREGKPYFSIAAEGEAYDFPDKTTGDYFRYFAFPMSNFVVHDPTTSLSSVKMEKGDAEGVKDLQTDSYYVVLKDFNYNNNHILFISQSEELARRWAKKNTDAKDQLTITHYVCNDESTISEKDIDW